MNIQTFIHIYDKKLIKNWNFLAKERAHVHTHELQNF